MDDTTEGSCPVWSTCATCQGTELLRVRVASWPGTAGFCWTQCDACVIFVRNLRLERDARQYLIDEHRKHLGLPEPPPPPAPWPVRLRALPIVLANPYRAADLVHRYFEGRQDDGCTPLYTGAAFERFASGGDHADVANVFTADDLVAVSMLSVQVPPRAALRILVDDAERLSAYLADVPVDVDLADVDETVVGDGSAADRLWWQLYGYPGVGSVTAGKLLARKRPRLIPVLDGVVRGVLGHSGKGYWLDLHGELRADDSQLVEQLNRIRHTAGLGEWISTIRVFDVLAWMTGKGALWTAPGRRSEPDLLF
jgi:hypothetical protein